MLLKKLTCLLVLLLLLACGALADETLAGFEVILPENARSGEPFTLRCTQMDGATQYFFQISTLPGEEGRVTGDYTQLPEWQCPETDLGAGQYYARAVVYFEKGMGFGEWKAFEIGEPAPENLFLFGEHSASGVSLRRYMGSTCPEVLEIPEMAGDKYVRRIKGDFVTAAQKPQKILLPMNAEDVDGIESIGGASFLVYTGSAGEEYCIRHNLPYELADDGTPDFEVEIDGEPKVNEKTKFYLSTKAEKVFLFVNGERMWQSTEKAGKRVLVERNIFTAPGTYTVRFMTDAKTNEERRFSKTLVLQVASEGEMPTVIDLRVDRPQVERRSEIVVSWEMPKGYSQYRIGHESPDEEGYYWIPFEKEREVVDGRVQWPFFSESVDPAGMHTIYVSLLPEDGMLETISEVTFEVVSTRTFAYDERLHSIFDFAGDFTDVLLPAEVDGMPVTTLETDTFSGKPITSLVIPSGVTRIEMDAAADCRQLKTLVVEGTHAVLFEGAFRDCTALTDITLPEEAVLWGKAFAGCTALTNIHFAGAPESIGPDAFAGCESLEEVVFPEGFASLLGNPFSGCTSLRAVTFPRSLKEIGSKIHPFVLPEGVTIRGYSGSRAEQYAKTFGYPFEALDD